MWLIVVVDFCGGCFCRDAIAMPLCDSDVFFGAASQKLCWLLRVTSQVTSISNSVRPNLRIGAAPHRFGLSLIPVYLLHRLISLTLL